MEGKAGLFKYKHLGQRGKKLVPIEDIVGWEPLYPDNIYGYNTHGYELTIIHLKDGTKIPIGDEYDVFNEEFPKLGEYKRIYSIS